MKPTTEFTFDAIRKLKMIFIQNIKGKRNVKIL